jgi:flagellar protein FlgJ
VQAATSKLAQAAASGAGSFDAAVAAARADFSPVVATATQPFLQSPSTVSRPEVLKNQPSIGRKFEAMVLQNFIENILPKNSELFGDAASADVARGMMAEQIANQLAKSGRIGIAKTVDQSVAKAEAAAAAAAVPPVKPQG